MLRVLLDCSGSSALLQFTVNRWDITFQEIQEQAWFNTAAQVGTTSEARLLSEIQLLPL